MEINHDSSVSYHRTVSVGYRASPVAWKSRRECQRGGKKAFAVTSPRSLDLNANIKVSLWIWNFMAVSRCGAVGETRLCTLA